MQFSKLASFQQINEAYLAESFLDAKGVETQIRNKNVSQAFGILTDQLGGIQLDVPTEKLEEARELLIKEGIISKSESKEYKIITKFGKLTDNWPLLNRVLPAYRLLILITLVIGSFLAYLALSATEEKRSMSEREMEYVYLPLIDELVENNPEKAILDIDKLLKSFPNNSELWFSKGNAYFNMDSLRRSYDSFLRAKDYARYPDVNTLYNLGLVKLKEEDYDMAIAHYAEGLKFDSTFLYDLGYAYELKSEIGKAIQSYSEFLKLYVEKGSVVGNIDDYQFLVKKIDSLRTLRK